VSCTGKKSLGNDHVEHDGQDAGCRWSHEGARLVAENPRRVVA